MKQPLARRLAAHVMQNLRGRKGLLDDVEPDIQEEIEFELANLIADVLAVELGGKADGMAVIV